MSKRRDLSALSRFYLGDLQVHPDRMVVVKEGVDVPLEPLWMDILVTLAEEKGEIVSTSQLQLAIWKTDAYGDNPVTKAISGLRKAIGDDARAPQYIQNLPKRGYRVIAPVSFADDYRRLSHPADHWSHGNPFVGLAAFDSDHAAVFAGRGNATATLLDAMRAQIDNAQRFVLIVGASGCGKTSLLRAGALPMLSSPKGFGGLRSMSVAHCDLAAAPAGDILLQLASALCAWRLPGGPVFSLQTPESLKARLCKAPGDAAPMIAEAFVRHPQRGLDAEPHAHLLLIVDHTEALASKTRSTEEQTAFECAVTALCDASRVLVIMVVRNDYYPQLTQALPGLTARKAGGHLDLLAPGRGEISDIIRKPAELANLHFETEESRLDDALRDAAVGQPDALPLLQHTLHALYEQRTAEGTLTWDAYRRIGGLEGAIAHHAEQVFSTLPAEAQDSLDLVLTRLVVHNPDSEAVTARRVRRDTLTDAANTLVDAFVAGRLFVGTLHDGQPHFGVVHEALLRQWPRAKDWVLENRQLLMAKAQLRAFARRWRDSGRRDDHLLNPGRPLSEALEVAQRFPAEIGSDEMALLRASERSRRRGRQLRNAAMGAMTALTIASMAATGIALQAKDTAEKRERESRRLTNFMLGPLAEELRRRDMLRTLGDVGKEAAEYLEDRSIGDLSPAEATNMAAAYRTVGEVLRSTGREREALPLFRQAHALADRALKQDATNQKALFERGNASYWLGLLEFTSKRYQDTAPHWSAYWQDSAELLRIDGNNPNWIMEMSYAENNLGSLSLKMGDADSAMKHFMRSIAAKRSLIALDSENPGYVFDLTDSMTWIASAHEASGQLGLAATQYDESIERLGDLIRLNKAASGWKLRLANHLMLSATLELGRGDLEKAERRAFDAIRILQPYVDLRADNEEWPKGLAKARLILAEIATARSKHWLAGEQLDLVLEAVPNVGRKTEENFSWRWIDSRARVAISLLAPDSVPNAHGDKAILDLQELTRENDSDEVLETFAHALLLRGHAHARKGGAEMARRDFRQAADVMARTAWKGSPFRTWLHAEALRHGQVNGDHLQMHEQLKAIGYARPSP